MIILLRLFCYLILVLLAGYSLLRYFHLWERAGIKGSVGRISRSLFIYLVMQGGLLVNLLVCQYMAAWIPWEPLLLGMQAVGCVYFSIILYSPVFCFLRGVIRFFGKRRFFHRDKEKKGRIYRFFNHPAKSIYIILGITACVGVFAFCHAHYLEMREYHMKIEKEAGTDSMSLVFVSDLHLGTSTTRKGLEQMVQKINDQSPDAVVMCGGIIDRNTSESWKEYGASQLSKIKTAYGVFSIEGEEERKLGEEAAEWFHDAGIIMLKDQRVQFKNGVQMIGLCDRTDPDRRAVDSVMANLKETNPVLVLSHRPEQLQQLSVLGADLAMCGHALSGQYPLEPLFDGIASDMVYGERKFGGMMAVATSGAGRYGIPYRLIPPSEIVSIQLTFVSDPTKTE